MPEPLSNAPPRKPKGYIGLNHMTRGGDLVSILKVLHTPSLTLGEENHRRLSQVDPEEWYPISTLLDMLELLDKKMGPEGLRSVGWKIFSTFHAPQARQHFDNARDLLHAFDAMYHQANRGHRIGGWAVLDFRPGLAEMEKTTPHHCAMETGILEEALRMVGVKAQVEQTECFREGAAACRFRVTTNTNDGRWSKSP